MTVDVVTIVAADGSCEPVGAAVVPGATLAAAAWPATSAQAIANAGYGPDPATKICAIDVHCDCAAAAVPVMSSSPPYDDRMLCRCPQQPAAPAEVQSMLKLPFVLQPSAYIQS